MTEKQLELEKLTKMSIEIQNQQLRFFAKVDISTKLKILEYQKTLFHKLKNLHSDADNAVLTLASLILAINFVVGELDDVNLNAIKLRGKNTKVKVKRQKVLGYWAIVRTLKLEQNMSFREIAAYFAKYHKLEVSYSTIYELWNELEKNIQNQEN
ncbi:MAG: helix-turn-helix domain-containing protein [Campylobacterales bacterium]|nr:helix-turn-helix domain-containing protein [Campylobacterales bacterium]